MLEVFQQSEPTAARRRAFFTLIDSTGHVAGKDITVTGVKCYLSKNGGTPALCNNDIVKLSASNMAGEYYQPLDATELDTVGQLSFALSATGCDPMSFQASVVAYDPYADGATAASIADALLARFYRGGSNASPTVAEILASGLFEFAVSGGVLTVKHSDGTTAFTRTLTRDATLGAITAAS